jgi:Ca2+-binding EF-hand superfamily protein
MANKKDHMEAELKKILAKDIGSSNPVFSPGAIAEMQQVFYLYTDQRQRRADVRDILLTASSLGLDSKFEMAFHLLEDIHDATEGNALDFETFLRELTAKIVSAPTRRAAPSTRKGAGAPSTCWTWRSPGSSPSRTSSS